MSENAIAAYSREGEKQFGLAYPNGDESNNHQLRPQMNFPQKSDFFTAPRHSKCNAASGTFGGAPGERINFRRPVRLFTLAGSPGAFQKLGRERDSPQRF